MRKILTLIFFLPSISFSFDESYFDGPIDQCLCAVIPNQCNKYCMCDPHCTVEQKEQFKFYLPETFSNNKIGCDPKNRIDKTNLDSIHKIIINDVNCYSINGNENGKKIENYNAQDFGFTDFTEAIAPPFIKNGAYKYNELYNIGDRLIGISTRSGVNAASQFFYYPIAIGSSTSNALLPLLAGYTYPKYTSRISATNPIAELSKLAFISSILDQTGNKTWISFPLHGDFNKAIARAKKFLSLQYVFPMVDTNGTYTDSENLSIKVSSTNYGISDIPDEFLSFSFEVFFGLHANYIDNEYQPSSMGYYYGVPIMIETGQNVSSFPQLFTDTRKSLQIFDGNDILFGVNSTIIRKLEGIDSASLMNLLKPNYTIYKAFGNPFVSNDMQSADEYLINSSASDSDSPSNPSLPISNWTFYYKKDSEDKPIMTLTKVDIKSSKPPPGEKFDSITIMYNIKFLEVDKKNESKRVYPKYDVKFLSLNYSAIFDVFFRDESETLETTGVFLCFALIGTIWCWYSCFFYIED